jgi:hypothetical protein
MTNKRVRRRIGDVVSIPLGEADALGLLLPHSKIAFFDARPGTGIQEAIAAAPIFILTVIHGAVTTGRWRVVGHAEDRAAAIQVPPTFMQDPLKLDRFQLYDKGEMRPATREECEGLERTAAWDPEHVEDRLRDAFAGVENKWVKSLRMQ